MRRSRVKTSFRPPQRQADFHPEIWIAWLPNRTPNKLKGWFFFSWHLIEDPLKIQVLTANFEKCSLRSNQHPRLGFRVPRSSSHVVSPPWLDTFFTIIQSVWSDSVTADELSEFNASCLNTAENYFQPKLLFARTPLGPGAKKDGCFHLLDRPGEVEFPARHVTFHSHQYNGQGHREVVFQRSKKSKLIPPQGKQNLTNARWNSSFFRAL